MDPYWVDRPSPKLESDTLKQCYVNVLITEDSDIFEEREKIGVVIGIQEHNVDLNRNEHKFQ